MKMHANKREEISEVLEVTVGRVSQLKKSALAQLREWMQSEIE